MSVLTLMGVMAMGRVGPGAWVARLDAWLAPFLAALPRAEQRRWAPFYGIRPVTDALLG